MSGRLPSSQPAVSSVAQIPVGIADLLESLSEGVILLDRAWRIIYANPAARLISRIQPEHLNGPSHWDLYPLTVGTEQERIYRRCMEERIPLDHEFYYPPFDLWIFLRAIPVPEGIAVYYQDISRLRRAEAVGDDNARRLQQVFDATTDGIFCLDRDFICTFANARARELLAPSGEIVGRNIWDAFPAAVYEDSPYFTTCTRAMERGISGSFEAWYPEPLNIWIAAEVQPSSDGIIIFFSDITGRRTAAAEIQRQREEAERRAAEIEAIYRTAPIGLAFFDPVEFRYIRLNDRQAAFFGLTPEQIVGRTLTEMAPIPGLHELFEQVAAGNPIINYPLEGSVVTDPREHRYWTVNYIPVYGPDGKVEGISAASLEITQQKRAEKALMQSEKLAAVGRLAASISHEINNPLESVTNLLYLLSTRTDLPAEAADYLRVAQEELARVAQIATQTLRFRRQSGKPVRITAEQLFEPVLRLYRGRLAATEVAVEMRLDGSMPVACLASEIRQVLNNLIANAIDAMPSGGRLLLRAHNATDPAGRRGIRIVVADSGHGISAATLQNIFVPFFTTKEAHGTGLGLWISSEIVARHHGRLTVRSSQSVHHGTVFTLFLPAQMENPE